MLSPKRGSDTHLAVPEQSRPGEPGWLALLQIVRAAAHDPGAAAGAPRWGSRPCCLAGGSVQSSRPALTCIIGARRAWIMSMISSISIPCRYTLVVETYECPSCLWITGSGTPSRASSTA